MLSAGVFARYALNRPLVWSDELASALFLWLAMLGSVLALGRSEHMRLDGGGRHDAGRASAPGWRRSAWR